MPGALAWDRGIPALLLLALSLLVPVEGWVGSIAVVSTYSYPTKGAALDDARYSCQRNNQRAYCTRHNYTCFLVVDWHNETNPLWASKWQKEYSSDRFRFASHWYKVFVLRQVLPKFSAVILLDSDTVFADLNLPFESFLDAAGERWWLMPNTQGITSHTLMLKNNPHSRALVERLWALRHVCPACPFGEQCAIHLLIYDLMLDWALRRGKLQVYVGSDQKGELSCCSPSSYCAYPTGVLTQYNPHHSWSVQGCTWSWWGAFQSRNSTLQRTHRHIHWVKSGEIPLNIVHPVKEHSKCMRYFPNYDPHHPANPHPITGSELWKILAVMPDYYPIVSPPQLWEFAHSAMDVTHCAKGKTPRSMRLCRIARYSPAEAAGNGTRPPVSAPLTLQAASC